LSKDEFFKAIVRERSLELGGEGVRKFDLILEFVSCCH